MARGKSVKRAESKMALPDQDIDIPTRAEAALTKKTLVKEWGINPWEVDNLTARDLQDVRLAEHAEAYIKAEQRDKAQSGNSLSKDNYNVGKSRKEAFGVE